MSSKSAAAFAVFAGFASVFAGGVLAAWGRVLATETLTIKAISAKTIRIQRKSILSMLEREL